MEPLERNDFFGEKMAFFPKEFPQNAHFRQKQDVIFKYTTKPGIWEDFLRQKFGKKVMKSLENTRK